MENQIPNASVPPPPPQPPSSGINWIVFCVVLLLPAAVAALGAQSKAQDLAVGGVVVGAPLAGIYCGLAMGRRFGRTGGSRVALGIAYTCVFGVVSFVIGFFGCMASGFNLNIH